MTNARGWIRGSARALKGAARRTRLVPVIRKLVDGGGLVATMPCRGRYTARSSQDGCRFGPWVGCRGSYGTRRGTAPDELPVVPGVLPKRSVGGRISICAYPRGYSALGGGPRCMSTITVGAGNDWIMSVSSCRFRHGVCRRSWSR